MFSFNRKDNSFERIISGYFADIQGNKCILCGNELKGHLFLEVSRRIWGGGDKDNRENEDYIKNFLLNNWSKLIDNFEEFDPFKDLVSIFLIKCPFKNGFLALMILRPFELMRGFELIAINKNIDKKNELFLLNHFKDSKWSIIFIENEGKISFLKQVIKKFIHGFGQKK